MITKVLLVSYFNLLRYNGCLKLWLGKKALGPNDDAVPVANKLSGADQVKPRRGAFDKRADNNEDTASRFRQARDRAESNGADADTVNRLYDGRRLSDPRNVPRFGEDAGATIGENNRDVVRRCVDKCFHILFN